jgi:hypothetical protein
MRGRRRDCARQGGHCICCICLRLRGQSDIERGGRTGSDALLRSPRSRLQAPCHLRRPVFCLVRRKSADGQARVLLYSRPVPRQALVDLESRQTSKQMFESIVRQPALQAVLADLEREQITKCIGSGASSVLKARDCDVTMRRGGGPWATRRQSEQAPQPVAPTSGTPMSSKACEEFPNLC